MTLCTAWIRQSKDTQELVFATDSCLSGGERWHSGVKLFELPRKDCLICFAGETSRTYPLILNLISSIKFDENLSNPHTDISGILEYLTNLFTSLCNSITNYEPQSFQDALGDFQFMFGGWSWKENQFKVWTLEYSHEVKAFLPNQISNENMFFGFIGDETDKAEEMLQDEVTKQNRIFARDFNMEPFKVLLQMIREDKYSSIDGAIQLAKIHPPGITEFFGVMWPSIRGKKTFLGKEVDFENNPAVRFIDPDTGEAVGEDIPTQIEEPTKEVYGVNYDFIADCYSEEKYKLKPGITKSQKITLLGIFRELAYRQFIDTHHELEQLQNDQEL